MVLPQSVKRHELGISLVAPKASDTNALLAKMRSLCSPAFDYDLGDFCFFCGVLTGGLDCSCCIRVSRCALARSVRLTIPSSYLWTLPAEYRFYSGQSSPLRMRYARLPLPRWPRTDHLSVLPAICSSSLGTGEVPIPLDGQLSLSGLSDT